LDPNGLRCAGETAFFKHLYTGYYARSIGFSYWRGKRDREVDMVADLDGRVVPFEVKYRSPENTGPRDLAGLAELCDEKKIPHAHVITRDSGDFGVMTLRPGLATRVLKIPAPLACFWLGQSELKRIDAQD
jgi:predicted AAA+ superfamily ATPase